jgi:hypothetical protein
MTVYLLHFSSLYRHARHYPSTSLRASLGYASDLAKRVQQHRNGTGARLPQVCAEHGIDFVVARTWEGGRDTERTLKRRKCSPKLCPICNPKIQPKG